MYACPSDSPSLLHPLCIVACQHVCSCIAVQACPGHPSSGLTPWVEYVNASPPLHSCIQTWVPLYCCAGMSRSSLLWSCTLVIIYICISTCVHVHLIPHTYSTPFALLHANLCGSICVPETPFDNIGLFFFWFSLKEL